MTTLHQLPKSFVSCTPPSSFVSHARRNYSEQKKMFRANALQKIGVAKHSSNSVHQTSACKSLARGTTAFERWYYNNARVSASAVSDDHAIQHHETNNRPSVPSSSAHPEEPDSEWASPAGRSLLDIASAPADYAFSRTTEGNHILSLMAEMDL